MAGEAHLACSELTSRPKANTAQSLWISFMEILTDAAETHSIIRHHPLIQESWEFNWTRLGETQPVCWQ